MQSAIRPILAISLLIGLFTATAWANTATEVFENAAQSIVVVQAKDAKGKTQGMGSGVVIGKEEIVTNCHVIENANSYTVKHDERQFTARLKHADWMRDVCSLTVKGLNARVAPLGSTKRLKVGQKVFAIGAPRGLELTLSEGILSSLRELDGGRYLQISAPISPGSSGGGLFDDTGKLIGLPTFYISEGQQLNFAVPVEWVQALPQRATSSKPQGSSSSEWMAKAIDLEDKRDWSGMLKHTRAWTRSRPEDAYAWYSLGVAYGNSDQLAKAIEAYLQSLRIDPVRADAWTNLGNAYNNSGQVVKAIESHQQALRIDPEYSVAWNNIGNAYSDSGQVVKAIESYQQALRINPEYSMAWYNLGNAYGKSDQLTKAIEAYQQALRIDPEDVSAWKNLGVVYGKSDQPTKAIEAYQQALRIDPVRAEVWYVLGVAYHLSGQRTNATEVYQRLKRLDPKRADKFFGLFILP